MIVCAFVVLSFCPSALAAEQYVRCVATNSAWGAVSPTYATLPSGKTVSVTATPNAGYRFVKWRDVENGRDFSSNPCVIGYDDELGKDFERLFRAYFEPCTYTVTFEPGEGTVDPKTKEVTYGEPYGELPKADRGGYTFDGWTNSVGKTITYSTAVTATSDHTLGAKWNYNGDLTVSVYKDQASEGSGSVIPAGPNKCEYGSSLTLQASPSTGSAFDHWSDGDKNATRGIVVLSNVTYYANFTLCEYLVSFKYRDKEGNQLTSNQYVKYRKSAEPPDSATVDSWSKHVFTGWNSDEYTCVERQMTIEANYRLSVYSVVFNGNGATGGDMSSMKSVECDDLIALSSNRFEKVGYTFMGWSKSESAESVDFTDRQSVKNLSTTDGDVVTLYAVWQPNDYTVEFHSNGGEGEVDDQAFKYDTAQSLSANQFTNGRLSFRKWSCSNGKEYDDCEVVSNLTTVADGVVTMTAVWSQSWFVQFNGNGATNGSAMADQRFEVGEAQCLTNNAFLKPGYGFAGWSETAGGPVRYGDCEKISSQLAEVGETKGLHAVWTANVYRVVYDSNDGKGVQLATNVLYDTSFNVASNIEHATHPLDQLQGWSRSQSGAVEYAPGQTVSNLVESGEVTLYAQWSFEMDDFSRAAGCSNLLVTTSVDYTPPEGSAKTTTVWSVADEQECVKSGFQGYRYLEGNPYRLGHPYSVMSTKSPIEGPGILTFEWMAMGTPETDLFFTTNRDATASGEAEDARYPTSEWRKESLVVPAGSHELFWLSSAVNSGSEPKLETSDGSVMLVRNIHWMPGATPPPEPGAGDARDISGVTCSAGGLSISFDNAVSTFDYVLHGTNDISGGALSQLSAWPEIRRTNGVGTIRFDLPADPLRPAMFYYLETASRWP